jgi:hypothetical protein
MDFRFSSYCYRAQRIRVTKFALASRRRPPSSTLSRPVAASTASTRPALCDAILGTCNAEDRCGLAYFFFRRLVVFFAAAFFAFLFFAIAALLA